MYFRRPSAILQILVIFGLIQSCANNNGEGGGSSSQCSQLSEFESNLQGLPDTTFDADGVMAETAPGNSPGVGVTRDSRGRVIVLKWDRSAKSIYVNRYKDNTYILDSSFNVTLGNINNLSSFSFNISTDCSDNIYFTAVQDDDQKVHIYKLNGTNGALDSSYGNNGSTTVDRTDYLSIYGLKIDERGNAFVYGHINYIGSIWKYKPDGTPDNSWGTAGVVNTNIVSGSTKNRTEFRDISILSDGRILVAGGSRTTSNTSDYDSTFWRFLSDGSIDQSFGNLGAIVQPLTASNWDYIDKIQVINNTLYALIKEISSGTNEYYYIKKFDSNGQIYSTFSMVPIPYVNSITSVGFHVTSNAGAVIIFVATYGDNFFNIEKFSAIDGSQTASNLKTSLSTPESLNNSKIYLTRTLDGKIFALVQSNSVSSTNYNNFSLIK